MASFVEGWRARMRALRNLRALLSLVWASGPVVVSSGVTCRLIAACLPIAMLTVGKRILDGVQTHTATGTLPPAFWWFVGLECALATTAAIVGRLSGFFDSLFADRFARHVSVRVMEHASQLDLATYENPAFQDTLERARVQATDRIAMVQSLGTLLQQAIIAATLSITILAFAPWLLALLAFAVIPAVMTESHFALLGYSLNVRQTPARRQLDYFRTLGASKESAKELRLFGLAPFVTGEFARLSGELYEQNFRLARRRLGIGVLMASISTGCYYAAYTYVVYRTVTGDLTWGSMQLVAGAIAGASGALQMLFSFGASVADQALFLSDLVEFFRATPQITSRPDARRAPRPIYDGFVFENVSFSYPGSTRRVLDDVSFRIAPGERIALVGENGQGKTTIVKLLSRLYDPTGGRILLDGVDLREYDVADLQREIGVIFQDFMRYELTARQNIAIGRMDRQPRGIDIEVASRKSLADAVVARLPQGYEQLLGRRFEGGVDLSGGEWQRIALARAYLRDAQLLILDEPTAALDARSEHEVFQRFADLTAGKMALLISHRFSTVRMADRIVTLEHGRIGEEGSHRELVRHGGIYARMFELQAAGYR